MSLIKQKRQENNPSSRAGNSIIFSSHNKTGCEFYRCIAQGQAPSIVEAKQQRTISFKEMVELEHKETVAIQELVANAYQDRNGIGVCEGAVRLGM